MNEYPRDYEAVLATTKEFSEDCSNPWELAVRRACAKVGLHCADIDPDIAVIQLIYWVKALDIKKEPA